MQRNNKVIIQYLSLQMGYLNIQFIVHDGKSDKACVE